MIILINQLKLDNGGVHGVGVHGVRVHGVRVHTVSQWCGSWDQGA